MSRFRTLAHPVRIEPNARLLMETYRIIRTQNEASIPVIPLPNPGEGGPVGPEIDNSTTPVAPLPNPGEGGPTFPGNAAVSRPSSGTSVAPVGSAAVRFLNATHGYPPFRISIDGRRVISLLNAASASAYIRLSAGEHVVSVAGLDGYTYIERALTFFPRSTSTVAIINRTGGLELAQIADACPAAF